VRAALRRRRWRAVVRAEESGAVTVSAEKGYLRETGNLAFHLALVALLLGAAAGSLWGWEGGALLTEGRPFCNSVQAYDQFTPGSRVRDASLPAFCVTLDDFRADYLPNGQADTYTARLRYVQGERALAAEPDQPYTLRVNEPLRIDGATMYLINTGYAPVLRYTDRFGTVFTDSPPFIPQDGALSSDGAFLLPDANQDPKSTTRTPDVQVAFEGFFLPTAAEDGPAIRSTFPAPLDPAVVLLAYRGDTGLDSGVPRSVYSVDQGQVQRGELKQLGARKLRPGQSWTLDDGSTLTFVGFREWMSVTIAHDPGERVVLVAAAVMLVGLVASLTVRRRRIWFRFTPAAPADEDEAGRTVVTAGGLARNDADSYADEFRATVAAVAAGLGVAEPREQTGPAGPADSPERD
ncbi:MAG TPA: cytochrome c biogenesis protein ResB, partial [Cryptosporangiaceae bacterium]|nr:cytochrome c biogenesis protein ResB [Cryptosporangiaceae bacterium]